MRWRDWTSYKPSGDAACVVVTDAAAADGDDSVMVVAAIVDAAAGTEAAAALSTAAAGAGAAAAVTHSPAHRLMLAQLQSSYAPQQGTAGAGAAWTAALHPVSAGSSGAWPACCRCCCYLLK